MVLFKGAAAFGLAIVAASLIGVGAAALSTGDLAVGSGLLAIAAVAVAGAWRYAFSWRRDWTVWTDRLPFFRRQLLLLTIFPICAIGFGIVTADHVHRDGSSSALAAALLGFLVPVIWLVADTLRRRRNGTLYIWDAKKGIERGNQMQRRSRGLIPLAIGSIPLLHFLPDYAMTFVLAAACGLCASMSVLLTWHLLRHRAKIEQFAAEVTEIESRPGGQQTIDTPNRAAG